MSLTDLHVILGRALRLFSLVVTLWSLILFVRRRDLEGNFWGTVVVGEALALAQGALGLARFLAGAAPARSVHFLYGVLGLLIWPAAFAFTRGRSGRREALIWAATSLFLFTLTFRSETTAFPL